MTRPKDAERLRQGTRKLWARKLSKQRRRCGLTIAEAAARANAGSTGLSQSTLRRYERSGPPTLARAVAACAALERAAVALNGGIQEDLEDFLRRKPRCTEVRT